MDRTRKSRVAKALVLIAVACCCAVGHRARAEMIFPGDEWIEDTPQSQGIDATRLDAATEYLKTNSGADGVRELVIVRNGRLAWKGDNIDHRHGVWSCTKSFTSTVLGLLIDDQKCTLDTRAAEFVPELAAAYPDVTLRHFATMTSGYRAVGDEPKGGYIHGPSDTPLVPHDEPLFSPPDTQYAYWDSAMNMFGLVLTRIAGEPIEDLFRRRIAEPIGMPADSWDWGDLADDKGLVVNGGSGNQGKHVTVSARELARLGHLFLNRGNWNGRQLISASWVEEATTLQVPADLAWAQPESDIDGRGCYGCNWWVNGVTSEGRPKWPGAPAGTFAALGYNNNRLFVIPEWGMVIVRLGLDQSGGELSDEVSGTFSSKIGEALVDAPQNAGGGSD